MHSSYCSSRRSFGKKKTRTLRRNETGKKKPTHTQNQTWQNVELRVMTLGSPLHIHKLSLFTIKRVNHCGCWTALLRGKTGTALSLSGDSVNLKKAFVCQWTEEAINNLSHRTGKDMSKSLLVLCRGSLRGKDTPEQICLCFKHPSSYITLVFML